MKSDFNSQISFVPLLALAALGTAGPAAAQTAPSQTTAPSTDGVAAEQTGIPDIVVTAEKRSTRLQKTPIAITAVTADKIANLGLNNVEQLQRIVPSLTYGQNAGYTYITVRGIGTDISGLTSESSIATYEDGVYTGALFVQSVPSFDLQRIEVLRGPQGTLYGRNTTGGVINYITKDPEFETSGNASVVVGSYDRIGVDAGFTGSLVPDTLAVRASGHFEKRGGYRRNLTLGIKEDDLNVASGRGSLLWTPDSDISFIVRGDYTRQRTSMPFQLISAQGISSVDKSPDPFTTPTTPLGLFSQPAAVLAAIPGLFSPADIASLNGGSIAQKFGLTQATGPAPPDPTRTLNFTNGYPTRYLVKAGGVSGTLDWQLGAVSVRSISAYRRSSFNQINNTSGTSVLGPLILPLVQTSSQITQEINLSGKAFDNRLTWLVGGFYFHDKARQGSTVLLPNFGDSLRAGLSFQNQDPTYPFVFNLSQPLLPLFQVPALESTVTINGPLLGGGTAVANQTIPTSAFVGFNIRQKSQSIAGFGQATYEVTDHLRVTGGLRYTIDKKDVTRSLHSNLVTQFNALFGAPLSTGLCTDAPEDKSWHALTGTAGVDVDLSNRSLAYAKYSRGYKSGGFNAGECSGSFNPEKLNAYEAGIKTAFASGHYVVNAAAFYYDYSDIQFTTYINNSASVRNAGAATLYGAELEFTGRPEFAPGLLVEGSGSYIRSKYKNGVFSDISGIYSANIGGNELIRSPKWRLSVAGEYGLGLGGTSGTVTLRGEASWTDTIYNDIFNGKAPYQAGTTQPSYWLVNARLRWDSDDNRHQVQLFGENLTNELYATNRLAFNTPATFVNTGGQFAAPRTFGVRLSTKFGAGSR